MTAAQMQYRRYLRSFRWQFIRAVRRLRDGNRCQTCYATKRLEVHHASYKFRGKWSPFGLGLLAEIMDTITLCGSCHERIHDR